MAKRLTPFIGLAVVAALALAAAFGAFSLSPAYAGDEAPNARGLAQPGDFQSQTAATALAIPAFAEETADDANTALSPARYQVGTNAPANMRLAVGDSFTVDLKDIVQDITKTTPAAATEIDVWRLFEAGGNAADPVVTLTAAVPQTGASNVDTANIPLATSTEVTITGTKAGAATLTVQGWDFSDHGDRTVGLVTGEVEASQYTFSVVVMANTLSLSGVNPGSNTAQTVRFVAPADLVSGIGEITIELEDFGFPGSTIPTAVGISSDARYDADSSDNRVDAAATPAQNAIARYNTDGSLASPTGYTGGLIAPDDISLSGEELSITVPDMNPENDRGDDIKEGDLVTVLIRQGAGINNPSEGGAYPAKITTSESTPELTTNEVTVPRRVVLSEEDGGRGTSVTATGEGFKNGTSLGFFLDKAPLNGRRDPGEVTLCDVAQVSSNDTGSCTFTVSNPPFGVGNNFVGAVDGRGQGANKSATHNDDKQKFELTPTISASPASGNPGDSILVQMYDFPPGSPVTLVDLARQVATHGDTTLNKVVWGAATTGSDGSANFRMTVPNWAPQGVLDLQVTAGGKKDNITITIGGPVVKSTPSTVLANQRINLVGTGFTPNSRVCCGATEGNDTVTPLMTIGGETIPVAKINDGDDVRVDSGGNWSASIDLPLTQVTSDEGVREIVVRDSRGRTGDVDVTIPARSVTIDPPTGRGGTVAVVRGENFPSKNDSGDSFNVEITYTSSAGDLRVSTTPDASGRFEAEITIPRLATIPSTNTVRVVYEYGDNDIPVTTTVTHQVPEGELSLSQSSGPPGTMVTVRGQGFRSSTPVTGVEIGDIEIPLAPAPYTTRTGGLDFEIRIPDLDTGVQTIEVSISGGTTASIGFTVTAGDAVGAETPAAAAVASMGDNFLRAFYFNNTTKSWSFYDPEVEQDADAPSALVNFIAGASYWVLIDADQEVILNRKTRNLTCVDGNCWNLVVW